MKSSTKVKVDSEDVDKDVLDDFERAISAMAENDSRHIIPDFLKQKVNPKRELRRIRQEVKESTSLLRKKKKR